MGEVGFALRQRMRLLNGTATKNDVIENLVRTSGHFGPIDVSSGILATASSESKFEGIKVQTMPVFE
jgi:hypothetical protein